MTVLDYLLRRFNRHEFSEYKMQVSWFKFLINPNIYFSHEYTTFVPATIAPVVNPNVKRNPNPNPIQGGTKITERHTSGNKDIRWLVSVDGVSSPEKNDTKISHFG